MKFAVRIIYTYLLTLVDRQVAPLFYFELYIWRQYKFYKLNFNRCSIDFPLVNLRLFNPVLRNGIWLTLQNPSEPKGPGTLLYFWLFLVLEYNYIFST